MKRPRHGQRGERQAALEKAATPPGIPSGTGPRPFASEPSLRRLRLALASPDFWLAGRIVAGFWGCCWFSGTVLAYQPVWHGGFLWDDDVHITQNRMLV